MRALPVAFLAFSILAAAFLPAQTASKQESEAQLIGRGKS